MVKVSMGNPKGIMKVLWEHVFVETSKDVCTYYKLCGGYDNDGKKILEIILRELMRNCHKFIKGETLLQTNPCKMGERRDNILFNRTPKCHPEISGEGIEYSLGSAKYYYRRLSLDKKKGKKISK